jgi:VWFA-related protein
LPRRWSLAAAVIVVLAAGHSATLAQKVSAPSAPAVPEPAAGPASASRPVRVEAIVTDQQGQAIVNLRPGDFSILENGVAQKVESAVLTSKAASASVPTPVNSRDDEERAAREPGTRVIAVYLDEFHVAPRRNTERVREAVSRFIESELRPADLVVVLKPMDHLTEIRFTRDRDVVRKAVAAFEGRKEDYTPRTPFEEQYLGRSPAAVRAARAQIVMSGLRALAVRMGELDAGLAGVVLVSEGFSTDVPRSRERRLPDLQGLARAANRFRVLLYAFDPGTTLPVGPDPQDGAGEASAANLSTAFNTLARQTGGDAVAAGDDLFSGLQRVMRDLDTYYVLTYRSSAANDGRFRNLQVSASRRDAHVRTRAGYWAPLPSELRATRPSLPLPELSMRALRRSPLIDSWFGSTVEPDGRRRVIFTWTPAAVSAPAKPTVRPELVAVKVSTLAGKVLFEGEVAPALVGSVGARRADSAVFDAPPGRLQFDLTILRADGSKLDTGAQDFDVPELRSGPPVILPPQLFRAASAREFREISADANAAPIPGREFRRTERLLMRVPTYDPAGARVQVSAKLINRVGTVMTDLSPTTEARVGTLSQFDLPLARFAPGEYSLEVSAQSDSGIARQLIRLRITG